MKLYQLTCLPYGVRGKAIKCNDGDCFYLGMIYTEAQLRPHFNSEEMSRKYVGDMPSDEPPETIGEIVPFCDRWIRFLLEPVAEDLGEPADITRTLLHDLHNAVHKMPNRPALSPELRDLPKIKYSNLDQVTEVLREFRDWAKDHLEVKSDEQAAEADPFLPAETPTDCARRINRNITTLKRYIENGTVRCEKLGSRLWRLHREDVLKLGGRLD